MKSKRSPILIAAILICIPSSLFSQSIKIELSDYKSEKSFLYSLSGEKTEKIDSVIPNENGVILFHADPQKYHTGFYRITFSGNKLIDFIYDGNDIELYTSANSVLDSLHVIKSESNKLFYNFIRLNKNYKTKTELLNLILTRFPKDDPYYNLTRQRLNELQNEYIEFVNIISQKEPGAFISKYIRSAQLPVVDISVPLEKQLDYLKTNGLNYVNFNDASLIYSDLFTNKSIEYLTYYSNPQFPKELLEKEFMKAVDSLLNKAKVNQLVYQHITEYLIDGFKKFGFDLVLDYIVENYVIKDDLCLDVKTEGMVKKRIDQAKYFKIGNSAPNILMNDINGNQVELNKISTEKTLIVFYASWCPHCKELLPKLNEFYKNKKEKKIVIVAISLDTKKEDWINFVKENCSALTNLADLKGWEGNAANDYYIYATPTMFLLDKGKKIISKPISFDELLTTIKE